MRLKIFLILLLAIIVILVFFFMNYYPSLSNIEKQINTKLIPEKNYKTSISPNSGIRSTTFFSSKSQKELIAYYQKNLNETGWSIKDSRNLKDNIYFMVATKDKVSLNVNIIPQKTGLNYVILAYNKL